MNLAIIGYSECAIEIGEIAERINIKENRWKQIVYVEKDDVCCEIAISESVFFNTHDRNNTECIIGLGEVAIKEKVFNRYKDKGFLFGTLIDPSAVVSKTAEIGMGSVVFPNTYIAHHATIGDNSIIHANSVIENYVKINSNCFISFSTSIGGYTTIDDTVFVGPNSIIKDRLHVGRNSIVGMGSIVTKDCIQSKVYYGTPAREIRENEKGRVFS